MKATVAKKKSPKDRRPIIAPPSYRSNGLTSTTGIVIISTIATVLFVVGIGVGTVFAIAITNQEKSAIAGGQKEAKKADKKEKESAKKADETTKPAVVEAKAQQPKSERLPVQAKVSPPPLTNDSSFKQGYGGMVLDEAFSSTVRRNEEAAARGIGPGFKIR